MFYSFFASESDKPINRLKLTVSALLMATAIQGCSKEAEAPKSLPAPAVTVYSVKNEPVGFFKDFVARTEASKSADVKARVEGELIARHFDEGGIVEEGQLLFEIAPAAYQASLTQAKAELESRKSAAEIAKRNLKRGREVSKEGFISPSDLDKLIAEDLQAKAAVSAANASLEKAELDLSYTQIKAPFTGRIGKVNYNTGNIVGPTSSELANVSATNPMYVNFQIDESAFISYLQSNQEDSNPTDAPFDISLRLPNNTQYQELGELVFADTKIEEGMGTVAMRAQFPNAKGIILPGLYVTIMIEGKAKEDRILVPQSAVQANQQGKSVLIVGDDNTVTQRIVTLGRRINAMWVVESGLTKDERIIVEGLQKVRAGIEVKAIEKVVDPVTGAISDLVN